MMLRKGKIRFMDYEGYIPKKVEKAEKLSRYHPLNQAESIPHTAP
jgi:hypothetical protein